VEVHEVFRLFAIATIAFVALGLACSPASAQEPQEGSAQASIEKAQKNASPLPSLTHPGRLSTRDRWRGRPYLRSTADETLRSHALDVALPSANPAFQGGVAVSGPGTFSSEDFIRNEALNKALPPANAAIVGGGGISGGGVGF
jgi:hypothetical protein